MTIGLAPDRPSNPYPTSSELHWAFERGVDEAWMALWVFKRPITEMIRPELNPWRPK